MTISFSYAYLNGFERLMVSSPSVVTSVHLPSLAISPLMTSRMPFEKDDPPVIDNQPTVHQNRLCDVVCVVASEDVINAKRCRSAIQSLSPKDATISTVVFFYLFARPPGP